MITTDRDMEVVKWHFPDDENDPTIFYLKKMAGAEAVYQSMKTISQKGDYDFADWCAENFGNVEKIENIDGKTLTDPNEIIAACKALSEEKVWLLLAAIKRKQPQLDLGLVEKN